VGHSLHRKFHALTIVSLSFFNLVLEMPPGPGVVALVGLNVAPRSSIVIGACIDKLFAMSTIKKFFKKLLSILT
jgi:hypothetical protein